VAIFIIKSYKKYRKLETRKKTTNKTTHQHVIKIMQVKSTITNSDKVKYNISDINQFGTKQTATVPV